MKTKQQISLILTFLTLGLMSHLFAKSEYKLHEDITYATTPEKVLLLDLYMPEGLENPPVVLWIHGGGWTKGDKTKLGVRFVAEGGKYAVASINYRFSQEAIFPAQIHDCKGAVRWLRANAEKYGYSANKIAVAGSSAGGMLSALLGTSGNVSELEGQVGGNLDQPSTVDAIIDYFGATDFILRNKTQHSKCNNPKGIVSRLFGGGIDDKVELATLASAVTHVSKDDPPLLLFHGDSDESVLLDQSQRIHSVYQKAGLNSQLYIGKGIGHRGGHFYSGKEYQKQVIAFLDQHLQNE